MLITLFHWERPKEEQKPILFFFYNPTPKFTTPEMSWSKGGSAKRVEKRGSVSESKEEMKSERNGV